MISDGWMGGKIGAKTMKIFILLFIFGLAILVLGAFTLLYSLILWHTLGIISGVISILYSVCFFWLANQCDINTTTK